MLAFSGRLGAAAAFGDLLALAGKGLVRCAQREAYGEIEVAVLGAVGA